MSTLRTATEQTAGAHVCRFCTLPLVQPQDAERTGRDWLVQLHCPSCGWSGEAMLDQGQMDDRTRQSTTASTLPPRTTSRSLAWRGGGLCTSRKAALSGRILERRNQAIAKRRP